MWKQDFCNNTFLEYNNRKQRVYCLRYCLKPLYHPAIFTSNVQCVRLAVRWRTFKTLKRSRLVSICFEDTDIPQGSVGTHFRRGSIFSDSTVANFILILAAKRVWALINILISYKAYKKCANFWGLHCSDCTSQKQNDVLVNFVIWLAYDGILAVDYETSKYSHPPAL